MDTAVFRRRDGKWSLYTLLLPEQMEKRPTVSNVTPVSETVLSRYRLQIGLKKWQKPWNDLERRDHYEKEMPFPCNGSLYDLLSDYDILLGGRNPRRQQWSVYGEYGAPI